MLGPPELDLASGERGALFDSYAGTCDWVDVFLWLLCGSKAGEVGEVTLSDTICYIRGFPLMGLAMGFFYVKHIWSVGW